jgi:hypothetical protein
MGAWEKVKQGASNIVKGEDPGIFGGGGGGSGQIIPGLDNPFQSGDKTWLPGLGAANPLNSQSVVGQAVKDLGALNVANPNSVAGKVVSNVVTDIGKDPLKWAAVAVAIAAGQPQLIPSIMSVAKLTSKPSSPEEWITEGIKAAAIKYGGDWVAANVAGASGYVGSTADGQDWIAGTGVRGATDSAVAAKVAANAARGMFVAAAQKGDTNIKGEQIITSAITNEGLNQAMAEIPGWDTLSKSEQSTAVNAFKVAFNKDESAAYNLFNEGFAKVVKEAELQAKSLGYNNLKQQVYINDEVYSKGTAEDRSLLNKAEEAYKTAVEKVENAIPTYPLTKQDLLDQAQGELEGLRRGVERVADDVFFKGKGYEGYGDFSRAANSGVDDPEVWKKIKAIEAKGGDDASTVNNARAAYLTALNKARALSSDPNRDEAALAQAREDLNAAAQAVQRLPDEISAKENAVKEGWDSLDEKKAAATAGYTDPARYDDYLTDKTADESAVKAGWDSLNQKNEAAAAGYTNPEQYDTYLVDKKADENAVKEGWTSADQKYDASFFGYTSPEEYKNFLTEQANQYELALARDNEKSAVKAAPPSTVVKEKGPENYSNDFGGAVGDTDYIPPWMDSSLTEAAKDPTDVVDTLVKSGLEDGSNDVDLNKVVAGADTVGGGINQDSVQAVTGADTVSSEAGKDAVNTLVDAGLHDDFDGENVTDEDAEQARRVAEFGKDLTGGGVQDLGEVDTDTDFYDENSTGMGAYKYDPTSGTYTYTSDDGSTLTLDADGNIVGFTETTDTSWTGLTDTDTGKLKLPGLPDGKLPDVKPPVKKITTTTDTGTTTTGTGNTAITTGGNTVIVTGNNTVVANSDNSGKLLALLGLMGNGGQQQAPYTPAQIPVADIKSYYNTIRGIAGENLLPESKEEKDKSNIDNLFAGGGTVNKSYDDVIRGIAGENLLDQPKEKKEKSSVEEMFFEGGTVDDLLRILRG